MKPSPAALDPTHHLGAIGVVELEGIMVAAVLHDVVARIVVQVARQFGVVRQWNRPAPGPAFLGQKAFAGPGRRARGRAHLGDRREVHGQASLQKGAIKGLQTGDGSQGVRVVVTQHNVAHGAGIEHLRPAPAAAAVVMVVFMVQAMVAPEKMEHGFLLES